MERRYGRLQGLVLALGWPSFYHDVARHWGGIGLLYLLLLFTLTWVPVLVKAHLSFSAFVEEELPQALAELPPITIENGRASSPVPQPYTINDPKTGQPVFVLDTTGQITSLNQTPAKILLTETDLHSRNDRRVQIHDLSQFPDVTITREKVQEWLANLGNVVWVFIFPIALVGSLIRALLLMLLAALFGLLFNAAFRAGLGFAALLRLAAVGLTASVYLDTFLWLVNFQVPFWFLIALAITTLYVALGVKAAGPAATWPPPLEPLGDDPEAI